MAEQPRPAPLLVVVSGKPATGKTTLGQRLAADLGLPFFARDALKETLFDALGVADRAWSRRLGAASFALLRRLTENMLSAGCSLVIEANFSAANDAPFYQSLATRYGALVAQVWLTAAPATIARRFEQRAASAERHPGHVELANMAEFRPALLRADDAPLPLDGALYAVDTTDFAAVAYPALLQSLRSELRLARAGAAGQRRTS